MNIVKKALEQYKDPLYRNSYYLMANTIVSSGLGFVFWMAAARFYTESDMGLAVALISAAAMVANISNFGLSASIVRFLSKHKDKRSFVNTCFTVVGLSTIVVSGVFLLGIEIWTPRLFFVRANSLFIAAFIIFTAVSSISLLLSNTFIAYRDAKYAFIQNTLTAALKIPLPIILAPLFGVFGVFGSWGIALTAAVLVSLLFFMRSLEPKYLPYPTINKKTIKEIFNFSIGNYIIGLTGTIPATLLPLIILQVLSAEDNAYFFVTFAIAGILLVIPGALSTSLFAEGSFDESMFKHNMKKAAKQAYLLLAPAIAITMIFGDKLLLLFGSTYSANGHALLSILALSSLFAAPVSFYNTYLRIRMRILELQAITIASAAGIIAISYALLPTAGIVGVGYAYLAVYAALAAYSMIRFKLEK